MADLNEALTMTEKIVLDMMVKGDLDPETVRPDVEGLAELGKGTPLEEATGELLRCLDGDPSIEEPYAVALRRLDEIGVGLRAGALDARGAGAGASGAKRGSSGGQVLTYKTDSDPMVLDAFQDESASTLDQLEESLILLERDRTSAETMQACYGHLHSVKGIFGFIEAPAAQTLAHTAETLIKQAQEAGRVDATTCDVLFRSTEALRRAVDLIAKHARDAQKPLPRLPTTFVPLLQELERLVHHAEAPDVAAMVEAITHQAHVEPSDGEQAPPEAAGPRFADTEASPVVSLQDYVPKLGEDPAAALRRVRVDNILRQRVGGTPRVATTGGLVGSKGRLEEKLKILGHDDSVRVDGRKLDTLLETLTELVIMQSQLDADSAVRGLSGEAAGRLETLRRSVRDVQELGSSLSMFPLREVFRPLANRVGEMAAEMGKDVRVQLSGEGTNLDKASLQAVHDPLIHLIRNAIDHGIEPRAERVAAGKAQQGTIRLSASTGGGFVYIQITDDGAGLDADRIHAKAIERGILSAEDQPDRERILHAIFEPGFSTRDAVTSLSGRGVGMDVVKRSVEDRGGHTRIASEPGRGTTITLCIPLSLAVIEGVVVRVGDTQYVLPRGSVMRSLSPTRGQVRRVRGRGELLNLSMGPVPLIRLHSVTEDEPRITEPTQATVLVCRGESGVVFGLMVDVLEYRQQVVLKPLGRLLRDVPGLSGATILGDGRVGMVLDAESVLRIGRLRPWSVGNGAEREEEAEPLTRAEPVLA